MRDMKKLLVVLAAAVLSVSVAGAQTPDTLAVSVTDKGEAGL